MTTPNNGRYDTGAGVGKDETEEGEEIDIGIHRKEDYENGNFGNKKMRPMPIVDTSKLKHTRTCTCCDECCGECGMMCYRASIRLWCCLPIDYRPHLCGFIIFSFLVTILAFIITLLVRKTKVEALTDYFESPTSERYEQYLELLNGGELHENAFCALHPSTLLYPAPNPLALVGMSGTIWLRRMLEEGTKLLTTSGNILQNNKCDNVLQQFTFRGECLSEAYFVHSIITSFNQFNLIPDLYKGFYPSAFVFIIREPFYGAIEEFGRRMAYEGYHGFDFVMPNDKLADRQYYESEDSPWPMFLSDYVTRWVNEVKLMQEYNVPGVNKLIVYYEDLYDKSQFVKEFTKLLDFIRTERGSRKDPYPDSEVKYVDFVSTKQFFHCVGENTFISTKSLPISKVDIPLKLRNGLCEKIGALWSEEKWGTKCNGDVQDEEAQTPYPTASPTLRVMT